MEQIIGAILIMIISGLVGWLKERASKRKSREIDRIVRGGAVSAVPAAFNGGYIPPVPAPEYEPLQLYSLPEEGMRVTDTATETNPAPPAGDIGEEEAQLAAHRERWRRAIIDSEILAKKF